MDAELTGIEDYCINNDYVIKKRIDKKIIVIQKHGEREILDKEVSYLLDLVNEKKYDKILRLNRRGQAEIKRLIDKKILVLDGMTKEMDLTPKWTLDEVFFELSKRCNLKCNHCYIPDNIHKHELTFNDWINITDQCSELGVYLIKLTGGEPMLNKYFYDLVNYIKSKGIKTRLYTNGSFLNSTSIYRLKLLGLDEIQISMDGASPTTHDSFRNTKGNYNQILSSLPLLEEQGIAVILSFTVSSYNERDIDRFIEIAKNFSNIKVVVSPYINYHQTYQNKNSFLDVNDHVINKVKNCFNENQNIWSDKTRYYVSYSNKFIGFCGLGIYSLYIDSCGKLLLCPLLNQDENVIGDIKQESLQHIWENAPLLKEYRKKTTADLMECNTCSNSHICRGGCRARAYFVNHNLLSKDPISCKMYI